MAGFSGITGKSIERKGKHRFLVNWRARLFMADKIIRPAIVTSAHANGLTIRFNEAVPLGTEMNLEFALKFIDQAVKIRIKAKVDYCLIKSNSNEVEIDISTTKISRADQHTLNNILQVLGESNEFNLRL
ncbi:hypothetical protein [Teredinibacter waterburyi]|uniref:hypothetical protein n=1 Tax=Teredinibacter waterburyi TaxID=1500538 RepID=UPI00165F09FF|nr:hypothetical protein [Teredinibacter waterburyi]